MFEPITVKPAWQVLTYLHADMAIKEHALQRTTPLNTTPGRYRPPEDLEAFLDQL